MTHHVWLTEEDDIHHGYPTNEYITWMLFGSACTNGGIFISASTEASWILYRAEVNIDAYWYFGAPSLLLWKAKEEGLDIAIKILKEKARNIEDEITVLEMKRAGG